MDHKQVPPGLRYTKQHEWVRIEGELAVVGITFHAQEQMGDITFVELPAPGADFGQGQEMCVVESVKAAADVYAPLAGQVAEINGALDDDPGLINRECYGGGWLVKLSGWDQGQLEALMDAEAYLTLLTE